MAQGSSFHGSFRLTCDIHVDGYMEGKINTEKTLIISRSGRVKGEIIADKVIINGLFEGECYANHVEILPHGKAQGTIHSDELSIERGGHFIGESQPTTEDQVVKLQQHGAKAELTNDKASKKESSAS
ncbi:polymer-forming cytoskeletal protein [Alkalimonas sp.]|uniref:bactofilin family protein n=1 Tax=Alkalimonas sp. TaxID=1872453 RepID=UPI003451426E